MPSAFPLCSKTCCWQGATLVASTDISLEPSVLGDVSSRDDDNTSPTAHFCNCPVQCAYSTHRDVPHPWAHHLDLRVPPDGVTTCPSPSPLRKPSPLKRFTPVTVSAGTCTYVPSKSPPHELSLLKCFAPATASAGLRHTHAPQGSRTTWRSPPPCAHCRTPAGQCLAT